MRLLRIEVAHIVEFLEKYRNEFGDYPSNLDGYTFEHLELREYVHFETDFYPPPYAIRFHPCTDEWMVPFDDLGIYHAYSPSIGYWYEDD